MFRPDGARRRPASTAARLAAAVALLFASYPTAHAAARAHSQRRAPASAKPSGKQATFGIGPANRKGVDGRPYLNFLSTPGAHLGDHVALLNFTRHPLRIRVYPVDAANSANGSIGFAPRSARAKDAGSWMSVALPGRGDAVTLAPRQTRVVPIRVSIPKNAQPGDHVAAIVASVTSLVTNRAGRRVNFEQRVALRTFFRLSGPLRPRLTIQNLTVNTPTQWNPFSGVTSTIHYTVRNVGNVRLSARQLVTVSGLFHTAQATAPRLPVLFPGGAASFTVPVDGVYPQFRMTVRVTLKPLTVLGDVDANLPPKFDASTSFWAVPWVLLVITLVLIAAAVSYIVRRRRRRKAVDAAHGPTKKESVPA